jgi:DNA-binding HxlR family transcriptional regulator
MNDKLVEHAKALILVQLLVAPGRKMKKSEANKRLTTGQRKSLDLGLASANQLREQLAKDGFLSREQKPGRGAAVSYKLTDRGLAMLGTLEQYPPLQIRMKGDQLNALIAAVRAEGSAWQAPKPEPIPSPKPVPERLHEAILAEFEDLRRERYSHAGLVPIPEVRRRVADKYGAEAARHDVFDTHVQQLRQQRRLRLVPISDLRDATPEQLNDAIPGVNETLFYLEPASEQLALS